MKKDPENMGRRGGSEEKNYKDLYDELKEKDEKLVECKEDFFNLQE